MSLPTTDLTSIISATFVIGIINILWHSPIFLGPFRTRLAGVEGVKPTGKEYLLGLVAALATAFVMSVAVTCCGAATVVEGALVGLLAWAGFAVPVTLAGVLYEGRPFRLFLLQNVPLPVAFVAAGIILAVM